MTAAWQWVPAERLDKTFGDRLGDCDHGWQRAWGSERQISRCSRCHCQLERRSSQAKAINLKKGIVGADARKGKRSINSAAAGKSSFSGTPTDLRRCDQSPISRLGVLNSENYWDNRSDSAALFQLVRTRRPYESRSASGNRANYKPQISKVSKVKQSNIMRPDTVLRYFLAKFFGRSCLEFYAHEFTQKSNFTDI